MSFHARKLMVIVVPIFLLSCNLIPQSEFDELQEEYSLLHQQNAKLQRQLDSSMQEIDFLKHGAPRLLNELKQYYQDKNWSNVIEVYVTLKDNFPNSFEVNEANLYYTEANEEKAWQDAMTSNTIPSFEEYQKSFPQGDYFTEAEKNIKKIKKEEFARRLQDAQNSNSVAKWNNFLKDYPDYTNRAEVERKIIELEVNAIFRDSNTGRIPQSQRLGNSNTTTSKVSVKNDTQYNLTLRYSGPSVKKIDIPPYGTKTIWLSSGTYRIAATAGGLNYAGSEHLSGEYSSKYYIVTSF